MRVTFVAVLALAQAACVGNAIDGAWRSESRPEPLTIERGDSATDLLVTLPHEAPHEACTLHMTMPFAGATSATLARCETCIDSGSETTTAFRYPSASLVLTPDGTLEMSLDVVTQAAADPVRGCDDPSVRHVTMRFDR